MIRRRLIELLAGAVILVAFPSLSRAQIPEYHVGDSVHLPDSLVEVYENGRFSIRVVRSWENSRERELIQRAERLYPDARLIEAAVSLHLSALDRRGVWPEVFEEAAGMLGDRWWWYDFDGTLLPFALTGAAVRHYIERVRHYSATPNPIAQYEPDFPHTGEFTYTAGVTEVSESGAVEVRLQARWSFHCGSRCGVWFTHSRRVVFDQDGNVLRVEGDRPPLYTVS